MKTPSDPMKIKTLVPLLLLAIGSSLSMAHGATLLSYDFDTNLSPSSNALNVSGTIFTATTGSVAQAAGPAASNANNLGTVSGQASTSTGTYTTTGSGVMNYAIGATAQTADQASAVDMNGFPTGLDFMTFTATAATGFELDLNTLSFDWARGGSANNRGQALFYSTDAFTTAASLGTYQLGANTNLDYTRVTYNLSSIPVAQAVTFRFYGMGNPSQVGRYDNLVLDGVVVIPEPSTLVLLGLAGIAALFIRRRA